MAYRKVAEENLTAIADAIRAKSGGSDGLVFPDGFLAALESIEAGGESKCIYGSFIPADDHSEIIIDDAFPYSNRPIMFGVSENGFNMADESHTLTRLESLVAVNTSLNLDENYSYLICYCTKGSNLRNTIQSAYKAFYSSYKVGNSLYNAMDGLINGETRQIRFKPKESGGYFLSGKTYYWFVLFGDDAI